VVDVRLAVVDVRLAVVVVDLASLAPAVRTAKVGSRASVAAVVRSVPRAASRDLAVTAATAVRRPVSARVLVARAAAPPASSRSQRRVNPWGWRAAACCGPLAV
jgi:hypothetical protein